MIDLCFPLVILALGLVAASEEQLAWNPTPFIFVSH